MRAADRSHTRGQAAEDAVADDELGQRGAAADGVQRRRAEGEERRALTEHGIDRDEAVCGRDDPLRRSTEEAADLAVAVGARNEDRRTDREPRGVTGVCHGADRFVAGHERVAESREGGHPSLPEETFGARADGGPGDVHDDIPRTRRCEGQLAQRELARLVEDDCSGVHHRGDVITRRFVTFA